MEINELNEQLARELSKLIKQKQGMVEYLELKLSQEDWHGVADAAMDIREIVSKSTAICEILEKI
jgi:hypothetical protein